MAGEKSTVTMADGTVIEKTEPIIPARTTTKQGVTLAAAVVPIWQTLQGVDFPWPWLNELFDNSLVTQLVTGLSLVLIGRFFKTPSDVGKIL